MSKKKISPFLDKHMAYVAVIVIIASLLLGYARYKHHTLALSVQKAEEKISDVTTDYRIRLENLENSFSRAEQENISLSEALEIERDRNEDIRNELEDITDTVGDLEKLSELDPELLQKYSKVYFLNEHYEPSDLDDIDDKWVYGDREIEIHGEVWPYLKDLLEEAEDDDIDIMIASGFRSFGTQAGLKASYNVVYGAGTANQFSADQGYSEHQLGTTVDFTTNSLAGGLGGFDRTEAFQWLKDNAYKYGFVLSYPEGNAYYQYEPWHWRFVGRDLARKLDRDNTYFYDFEQRRIDQYLIELFD